jgi:hypothetical protein
MQDRVFKGVERMNAGRKPADQRNEENSHLTHDERAGFLCGAKALEAPRRKSQIESAKQRLIRAEYRNGDRQ